MEVHARYRYSHVLHLTPKLPILAPPLSRFRKRPTSLSAEKKYQPPPPSPTSFRSARLASPLLVAETKQWSVSSSQSAAQNLGGMIQSPLPTTPTRSARKTACNNTTRGCKLHWRKSSVCPETWPEASLSEEDPNMPSIPATY